MRALSVAIILANFLVRKSLPFSLSSLEIQSSIKPSSIAKRAENATQAASQAQTNCGPLPCVVFSETEQFVSTAGEHAFQSPGPNDIRGPCPGLNAAANHGYLSRSGITTIPEKAFGMGADLAGFLAAFAVVYDGDPTSLRWSIGGPFDPAISIPLAGRPKGISFSHNDYEGDASIGRGDAYMNNGDAFSLNIAQFNRAFSSGLEKDRYTLDGFRWAGLENQLFSIRNNPYYFAPHFAGTLVAPAAYNFVINFMSNHSAEEPSGYLNGDMFKQFFAVEGEYPDFTWNPGQERIPDNWYRRTSTNQYDIARAVSDVVLGYAAYPSTFRLGGNTGGVNTYAGVDVANLTGGIYNAENLFQGDNFACLFFQLQQYFIPDIAMPVAGGVVGLLGQFTSFFTDLACPDLEQRFDKSMYDQFPGVRYRPEPPS